MSKVAAPRPAEVAIASLLPEAADTSPVADMPVVAMFAASPVAAAS